MSLFLYELVKSMTLNEKVYFKRNANTHSGKEAKNYLKIYNLVEKAQEFDKSTLKDHFKGTTIEKYLSSEVNYLKEKILISLFNYNMNSSVRNQIQKGILLVESLATKGFQKEALKKLKVVKKTAIRQEEFTSVLRIIELEEILIFKEGAIGYREQLSKLQQQRSEAINLIQNLNSYHILRQEIRELQFSDQLFRAEIKKATDAYKNPLVQSEEHCMSIRAKEHWYYIRVLLSYLKRDFKEGLNVSSEYVDFMNRNTYLFDKSKRLPAISNYIYHGALNSDKFHFEKGILFLSELSTEKEISLYYRNYILYTRYLEFAYYTNDLVLMQEYFDLTTSLIDMHSDEYEESQIQYLLMGVVRVAIILKQFEKGVYYSNLWQQRGVLSFRTVQARLFSIIIHYELGYTELLKSEIVLLKKLEKKYTQEKVIIRCFYDFIKATLKRPEDKSAPIKSLQKKLNALPFENKEFYTFISFNYYTWSLSLNE